MKHSPSFYDPYAEEAFEDRLIDLLGDNTLESFSIEDAIDATIDMGWGICRREWKKQLVVLLEELVESEVLEHCGGKYKWVI